MSLKEKKLCKEWQYSPRGDQYRRVLAESSSGCAKLGRSLQCFMRPRCAMRVYKQRDVFPVLSGEGDDAAAQALS